MATPNLGLTIPVGGATAGSITGNTTPGTYPYIESANLNLIDSLCYSLANPVPTAGININADLSFNGFNLTSLASLTSTGTATLVTVNASGLITGTDGLTISAGTSALQALTATTGVFSGNVTVDGTLSITTLTVPGTLTVVGASTVAAITASGLITGSDGLTISAGTSALHALTATTGSFSSTLGVTGISTLGTVNASGLITGTDGLTISSGTSALQALTATTGSFTGDVTMTGGSTGLAISNSLTIGGTLKQVNASTSLSIFGNAAATGAVAVITDNQTTQSSGTLLSVRTGGTEKANVDFGGNINLTAGGSILQGASSTSLTLKGNAAATSAVAVITDNAINQTSGTLLSIRTNGTEKANIDYLGNLNLTAGGSILQGAASTSLTLKGNASASGIGSILDNVTTQTSGKITSFRTGGTEKAYLDNTGSLFVGANGVQALPASTTLTLEGNVAATAGTAISFSNQTNQTSGNITQWGNGGPVANMDWNGNLFCNSLSQLGGTVLALKGNGGSTGPAVTFDNSAAITSGSLIFFKNNNAIRAIIDYQGGLEAVHVGGYSAGQGLSTSGSSIPSNFGTPTITGNDVSGTITIVCSSGTAISSGTLFQINFGQAYTTRATCIVQAANTLTQSVFGANTYVATTTTQVAVSLTAGVTPSATTYVWNYVVMGN